MREYLFRGKRENGEWLFGCLTIDDFMWDGEIKKITCIKEVPKHRGGAFKWEPVIDETVGQFTALTDRNGKKIFEGDIVKAVQTEYDYDEDKEKEPIVFEVIGEMIFEDACFGLRAKHIVDFYAPMWQEDNVELEVIGNIYDNPELLGEQND